MSGKQARQFHGTKDKLLGKKAGKAAPAWKEQQRRASAQQAGPKSKILLSNLPKDVKEVEVEVRVFYLLR
jgi:hypothetical protein